MKWSFAIWFNMIETSVLAELIRAAWWGWIGLFLLVAWWHYVIIHSWTYWTAIEERDRARGPKGK